MTLNRRSFLSMTAIAASLTAAAACSSDDTSTEAEDTTNEETTTEEGSEEEAVTRADADLVIWADELKAGSLEEIAATWGEEQGITVAVQAVADDLQGAFITANQAGNGPDIVLGAHDWIGNMVQNGSISPVTIADDAQSNFSDIALTAMTYDSQFYGVPYSVECVALYVNKGLTDVTEPATIEELAEAGKAAGTDVVLSLPVGESGDAYHMEPIYTSGGGYLFGTDADGNLDPTDVGVGQEGSIAAAKKIGELGEDGVLSTSVTGDNAISMFTEGKAPYLVSGPWALADIKAAEIDYSIVKIPGFEGLDEARPFAGVNGFYVAANGQNKAFAETFLADVAKDSRIAAAMFEKNELPPAQKDLIEELSTDYADLTTFASLAENAEPMPSIPEMASIWGPLGMAEANIVGGADPESTIVSAGEEIVSSIEG